MIARDESSIRIFRVGCSETRPVGREVSIVIRPRTEPLFSTSGRYELDGRLDDAGAFVISGQDVQDLKSAILAANDDEGLSFSGYEVLTSRRNRFEFTWSIANVQRWLQTADIDTVIYGSQLRGEVPADMAARPCRVVDS